MNKDECYNHDTYSMHVFNPKPQLQIEIFYKDSPKIHHGCHCWDCHPT